MKHTFGNSDRHLAIQASGVKIIPICERIIVRMLVEETQNWDT
jgi:hypothetical protein